MRIHTNMLTPAAVRLAVAELSNTLTVDVAEHGSHSRVRALEVKLYGTSKRRPNDRGATRDRDLYAATWDEWGILLDVLFHRDPRMAVPHVYESHAHFAWLTGNRFDDLRLSEQHRDHKWVYATSAGSADNSYSVDACTGCDAERRTGGW